jgi:SAM-dependent methyltransferase
MIENFDQDVVNDFGREWNSFPQFHMSQHELTYQFNTYFNIFPWEKINKNSVGFDAGCGSGRWAKILAPMVGHLHCVEPSESISVAMDNLKDETNCTFHQCAIDKMPFDNGSMDFGYAIGVLHHVPDTELAIRNCVDKLKKGGIFLVYIYYSFDNRPIWYGYLWRASDILRRLLSKFPFRLKLLFTEIIAILVYFPLARVANILDGMGFNAKNFPLYGYRKRSLYSMRTDALDRFGTKLEKRFSKEEIAKMLNDVGIQNLTFNDSVPYWCAVGIKSS